MTFNDKIKRKLSKKKDEENFNKGKNHYKNESHNLNRNNRQYNKMVYCGNNYINDDYDDYDYDLKKKK